MSVHLPIDVFSPGQLSGLVASLHTYRGSLRDAAVRAKTTKTKPLLPELPEGLANLLTSSTIKPDDLAALETLNKELEGVLKAAPVMHVTLAAGAGRTLKRQLTVWFRTQIHPHSLLTFATRSDMGGGIILQAGSRFYDFSFRDRLLANKNRLTEIASVR